MDERRRQWAKEWTGAGMVRGAESARQLNARLICGGRAGSGGTGQSGGAGRVEALAEWRRRQSEGNGRAAGFSVA